MSTCLASSRAHAPMCLECLLAFVSSAYVLLCLRAYVLECLRLLCANVPCVLICSRGNVPCVLTCTCANVPHVLTRLVCLCTRVSKWFASSNVHVSTYFESLASHGLCDHTITCQHALTPQ